MVVCDVCSGTGMLPVDPGSHFAFGDPVRLTRKTRDHQPGDVGTAIGHYMSTGIVVVRFQDGTEKVPHDALELDLPDRP